MKIYRPKLSNCCGTIFRGRPNNNKNVTFKMKKPSCGGGGIHPPNIPPPRLHDMNEDLKTNQKKNTTISFESNTIYLINNNENPRLLLYCFCDPSSYSFVFCTRGLGKISPFAFINTAGNNNNCTVL